MIPNTCSSRAASSTPKRALALASMCMFGSSLIGCNVAPKYTRPAVPAPPAFKEDRTQTGVDGSVWKLATPRDGVIQEKWWEVYREPELNSLEEQVDISNQNVAQAYANFMAARAQVREARSSLYPTIGTNPAYTRSRTSQNSSITPQLPDQNLNSNVFDLPFGISWEADVWGRVRNSVRKAAYTAQVSAADLQNVRLSMQANVATDYFELRAQDALTEVFERTAEADRHSLELTRSLYKAGLDNDEAVAQAEVALKNAEIAATNTGIARAQYEHAIALLIGKPSATFSLAPAALRTEVPEIPTGLPSDLLERRPDIAAAERTVAADNAQIGIERAAYYPTLTLSGTVGLESLRFSHWFTAPSRFWSVGPIVSETIFDGGLRKATVTQFTAQYASDVAAYRQTVLAAFQQVEDALASLRTLQGQVQQQQQAVDSGQRYFDVASARYQSGLDPYINVFTAQTTLLSTQQQMISAHAQQMVSSVQLIQALGGGWDAVRLPSESSFRQP